MATQGKCQSSLDPRIVAQAAAKKGNVRGCVKPAPEIPTGGEEAKPDGTAPKPNGEDIAALGNIPKLSGWQAEGGPTREEFCRAQQHCTNLEGLRRQADAQAAIDTYGNHLI